MVRNLVAGAVLAVAGTLFCVSEPALAGPRGGAMPGFRPAMMHAARPQFFFRGAHRSFAPGASAHYRAPPSPRAYGTINPTTPYGTINPATPYGTIKPTTPYGTIKPASPYGTVVATRPYGTVGNPVPRFGRITLSHPRAHLARRHHRAYHAGWGFPVTTWGEAGYIGTPYDPSELIPVYGPTTEPPETDLPAAQPAGRRVSVPQDNPDACRSERVTVPAAEGEREITVVRC